MWSLLSPAEHQPVSGMQLQAWSLVHLWLLPALENPANTTLCFLGVRKKVKEEVWRRLKGQGNV